MQQRSIVIEIMTHRSHCTNVKGRDRELTESGLIDRRGLFAFVVPTSFISSEQPPSAQRLYDRNQSEGNRPYTPTDVAAHQYRH